MDKKKIKQLVIYLKFKRIKSRNKKYIKLFFEKVIIQKK